MNQNSFAWISVHLIFGNQYSEPWANKSQRNTFLKFLTNFEHQKSLVLIFHVKSKGGILVQFHIEVSPIKFDGHVLKTGHYPYLILFHCHYSRIIGPEMKRLFNITDIFSNILSSSCKITSHKPSIVILSLSIQSDYLCAQFQCRHWVVVTTPNLAPKRIYSQPTSFGVLNYLFIIWFLYFFIGQTRALVTCWIITINTMRRFKHACYFWHLL